MRRVSVIGVSGSGKSTVARRLAERLGVPFVELDAIFWQPDWVSLPREEFRAKVAAVAAGDGWVIDGNYGGAGVQDLVWDRADTVAWIDLPRRTVMRQIVLRTLRRIVRREELWSGNRERWRNFFTLDQNESVIMWAWHGHPKQRAKYASAMADPAYGHLTFVRLRSRREVEGFLAEREPVP